MIGLHIHIEYDQELSIRTEKTKLIFFKHDPKTELIRFFPILSREVRNQKHKRPVVTISLIKHDHSHIPVYRYILEEGWDGLGRPNGFQKRHYNGSEFPEAKVTPSDEPRGDMVKAIKDTLWGLWKSYGDDELLKGEESE